MTLKHVAIRTNKFEELKDYCVSYFGGTPNNKYTNAKNKFHSYLPTFKSGARLEIMTRLDIPDNTNDTVMAEHKSIIHLAFGVDTKGEVEGKTKQLQSDGFKILSGPRRTGDGYYEFETLDPDNNRLEVATKWDD